jgi:hypothetical protein
MKNPSGLRNRVILSESTHHQLNMYVVAASAAGVGMLATVQPAAAKVVYTPANVSITLGNPYSLDLNHDGVADFKLQVHFYQTTSGRAAFSSVLANGLSKSNSVVVGNKGLARAFRAGITIGPKQLLGNGYRIMARCDAATTRGTTSYGNWLNVANRYLGLKFTIKGKIHYGWARLTVGGCPLEFSGGTLTGYAYETTPNKPIMTGRIKGSEKVGNSLEIPNHATLTTPAPKPASLGLLALGSPALSIWRRKESVGATAI